MKKEYIHGVRLSDFSNEDQTSEALKGYWARNWGDIIRLTIVKSHVLLSSIIVDKTTAVKVDLPQHKPFYLTIANPSGVRIVKIDEGINVTLAAGESMSAVFTVEI